MVLDQRGKGLPLEYIRKMAGDTGVPSTEDQLHRWPSPQALTSSGTVLGNGSGVSGGQTCRQRGAGLAQEEGRARAEPHVLALCPGSPLHSPKGQAPIWGKEGASQHPQAERTS